MKNTTKIAAANAACMAEEARAPDRSRDQHDASRASRVHLLDKAQVCAIANVTFPTLWTWMRKGKFPRSLVVGGKSMWRSDHVDAWLASLPVRVLKGDASLPGDVAS